MLPAPLEREWLWAALETLVEARGEQMLLTAPILVPDDRCFPDRWTPDSAGVAAIAKRLLGYAGIGHLAVDVEVFVEATEVREVGLDGRAASTTHAGAAAWFAGIRGNTCYFGAEQSKLDDPLGLVGSMAHEIGHAFRRVYRLERDDRDMEEKLTDVTTIYLGFGILTTASASRFITRHHDNLGSSYAHTKQGYLASHEMAFMLASQLSLRGYDNATIRRLAKHLPSNQRATIRAALADTSRELIANAMGFERVPDPVPPPATEAKSWFKRLLGG
ncbi:MAG: hypothetical protein H0V17_01735 [Deltaproteobacteria bacterium]|nr:hypothetical protein [Deltaproteobacteria bacterium]